MDDKTTPPVDDTGPRNSVPPMTPPEEDRKRDPSEYLHNPRTREAARDAIVLHEIQRIMDQAAGYVKDMKFLHATGRFLFLRIFSDADSVTNKILAWLQRLDNIDGLVKNYQSGRESDIKLITEVLRQLREVKKGQDNFALALAGLRSDIAEIKKAKNPARGVSPTTHANKSKKTATLWDRVKTHCRG